MKQQDVERSQEFRKCIECFLCQNTCHVIRDHEENKEHFAGPRFLMRVAELEMHPLDAEDRVREAQEEHGLGYCNITKCCTEVCPEHIKITDNALIPMKERVADRKYDPIVWLGSAAVPPRQQEALTDTRQKGRPRPGAPLLYVRVTRFAPVSATPTAGTCSVHASCRRRRTAPVPFFRCRSQLLQPVGEPAQQRVDDDVDGGDDRQRRDDVAP